MKEAKFLEYLQRLKKTTTHEGKRTIIYSLLADILGIDLTDFAPKSEINLNAPIIEKRGRADLIYNGVVLEIKVGLDDELEDAIEELTRYLEILKNNYPNKEFIGIATDGFNWKVFVNENNGIIKEVSKYELNMDDDTNYEGFILWISLFLSKETTIKPTAEKILLKFGRNSPIYNVFLGELKKAYELIKDEERILFIRKEWEKHLEIIYGEPPVLDDYIEHTYLIILVKLIMGLKFDGKKEIDEQKLTRFIDGSYFADAGIENFAEEDFFTWILEEKIKNSVFPLLKRLFYELFVFDFSKADEDLFKEIYQEIVGPSVRHRIGEYYTPEWLTELTLEKAWGYFLKQNPSLSTVKEESTIKTELISHTPSLLDPACGSGTFLTTAIYKIKKELENKVEKSEILEKIISSVKGIDINPLAVIVSRANYLIALGDLLFYKKHPIFIPVYLSDTIRTVMLDSDIKSEYVKTYLVEIEKNKFLLLPEILIWNETLLQNILDKMKQILTQYKFGTMNKEEAINTFIKQLESDFIKKIENAVKNEISSDIKEQTNEIISNVLETFERLIDFIDKEKDSIWIYILRNLYAPLRMKREKFDIVVGNPPWVSLRYVENQDYQEFLKTLTFDRLRLLNKRDGKLFTQIELATIFFRISARMFLKESGVLAFVMPRSVLTASKQHKLFQEFKYPDMEILEILDFNYDTNYKVFPLFKVPSCVIIAKSRNKTENDNKYDVFPVKAIKYNARLPKSNLKLREVEALMEEEEYLFIPPETGKKSIYLNRFRQGASIVPRTFWFVDLDVSGQLGIDPIRPKLVTSSDAIKNAKDRWKNTKIEGKVEREFLFATLLSKHLKPCGYSKLSLVLLPIKIKENSDVILLKDEKTQQQEDEKDDKIDYYLGLKKWVETAQKLWIENATEKDRTNFPHILMSINRLNKLTSQDFSKRYVVVYPASGKHLVATVIDRENLVLPVKFNKKGKEKDEEVVLFKVSNFVLDTKTYGYFTDNEEEAYYLSAILNSEIMNQKIKSIQSRGLYGERDIHKRPFEVKGNPIPLFDPKNKIHSELARLGKECQDKSQTLDIRSRKIPDELKDCIEKIDNLVSQLLG